MCTDKTWLLQQTDTLADMYTQQHAHTCNSNFQSTLARGCVQGGRGSYASDELGEHDGGNVSQCFMVTGLQLSRACTCMFFQCQGRNMHPTLPTEHPHVRSNLTPHGICVPVACDNMETMAGKPIQDGHPVQTHGDHQFGFRSLELVQHHAHRR